MFRTTTAIADIEDWLAFSGTLSQANAGRNAGSFEKLHNMHGS